MMAAPTAIGNANRCRCAARLDPRLFRGTGFDHKTALVVQTFVFLSHSLDRSIYGINRLPNPVSFLLARERRARPGHTHVLTFTLDLLSDSCCLILDNPEKNYRALLTDCLQIYSK